mmetsp:Transcript_16639/g.33346  ORF Transcript_16639/g.33346 Transcript_16639/m.33346 type:complete len:205 (+) Transcript_16639:112-726(+)
MHREESSGRKHWRIGSLSAIVSTWLLLLSCLALVFEEGTRRTSKFGSTVALGKSPRPLDAGWPSIADHELAAEVHSPPQGRKLLMLSSPMLILTIGDGLFALIFLYVVLIIVCFVGCNLKDGFALYIPAFLVVLLITLVLALAPKVPRDELEERREANALRTYDEMFIPQTTIIVLVCFGAVLGLVFMFLCHCITPVYIRSLDD